MFLQAAEETSTITIDTSHRLPNSATADIELQRRIRSFLDKRQFPQSSRIKIEANVGVVTLRGTHRSYYHKQLCINFCQRVAGVVRLIDATKVVQVH